MRRIAVLVVCTAFALDCTEKWLLPGVATDGGRDGTVGPTGSGGRGGSSGSGGAFGTGGRTSPGTGGSGGPPCNDRVRLDFMIQKADLVFSVGRNASMATKFGDGTRMSAVQQTLRALVTASQNAVNFGYQDFPSTVSCFNGNACCANSQPVYPFPQAFGAIDQAMRMCDGLPPMNGCVTPSDSRPIGDALKSAINPGPPRIPIFPPDNMRDRYLVLMVDGAPGCSMEDPMQSCLNAQNQVSQLRKANINLYVVPVGEDAEMAECLKTIALQANTGTASVPFAYLARDPNQLMQSMTQIVDKAAAATCVINLLDVPADTSRVELYIQNHRVPRDANGPSGWSFIPGSPGKIEVHGGSCQELQEVKNPGDIEVWAGCPP